MIILERDQAEALQDILWNLIRSPSAGRCPYGQCTMVNLCKTHCVRQALERDGWTRGPDGSLQKLPQSPSAADTELALDQTPR
jgi:hypothetical protein